MASQSTQRLCSHARVFFFLVILCVALAMELWRSLGVPLLADDPEGLMPWIERSTSESAATFPNKNPMCEHVKALYSNSHLSDVHDSIRKADDFHAHGGSLTAVQEYLDRQIAQTLTRLDLTYQPKDQTDRKNNNLPVDSYLHEYFATHNVPRGGYGQPLPLTFQNRNSNDENSASNVLQKALHKDRVQHRWMDVMEPWTHERFQVAVGPQLPTCPHLAKFSEGTYEAKNFCIANSTHQHHHNDHDGKTNNGECHIFSIGSNDQWGFEEELRQKLPDCHVHTFDCTLKNNTPRRKPKDPKVHFYPHCVSGKEKIDSVEGAASAVSKSFKTYDGLVKETGIQHPPKVLKMDIEGFEFEVLNSMLKSPSQFWPEQIMMEVHFASRMIDLSWLLRTRQTAEMAMFFDLLYNKGGYMPAHIKYINGCSTCMEILLLRVHCS